jgi:PAS domain S-box-containing protein
VKKLTGPVAPPDVALSERRSSTGADAHLDLLEAIIDSTDDAVLSIDLEGHVTSWNQAAESLYGLASDAAMGVALQDIVHADLAGLFDLLQHRDERPFERREIVRTTVDGIRAVVEETPSLLHNRNGELIGAVSISHDIRARKKLQGDLAEALQELEKRNRRLERSNSELEQFAYVASHDLSEPLRAVAGMVELLSRRYSGQLGEDADEFIKFAVDGCVRMRSMIDDLLAYSRSTSGDLALSSVSMGDIVVDVTNALSVEIAELGAQLEYYNLPEVNVDRIKVTQVLQNLVSNSLKFRRPNTQPRVLIAAVDQRTNWKIEVSDNGIGISEQYRKRVFEMFERLHTREEYSGTGIGLAIVDRIVAAHGGEIGVADNSAGGTTIWFTVPKETRIGH